MNRNMSSSLAQRNVISVPNPFRGGEPLPRKTDLHLPHIPSLRALSVQQAPIFHRALLPRI